MLEQTERVNERHCCAVLGRKGLFCNQGHPISGFERRKAPNNTWCSAHPHSRGPCNDEPWLRWRFVFAEPWAGSVLVLMHRAFRHRAQLQLNRARVEVPSHYLTKVFSAPWVSTAQIGVSASPAPRRNLFLDLIQQKAIRSAARLSSFFLLWQNHRFSVRKDGGSCAIIDIDFVSWFFLHFAIP